MYHRQSEELQYQDLCRNTKRSKLPSWWGSWVYTDPIDFARGTGGTKYMPVYLEVRQLPWRSLVIVTSESSPNDYWKWNNLCRNHIQWQAKLPKLSGVDSICHGQLYQEAGLSREISNTLFSEKSKEGWIRSSVPNTPFADWAPSLLGRVPFKESNMNKPLPFSAITVSELPQTWATDCCFKWAVDSGSLYMLIGRPCLMDHSFTLDWTLRAALLKSVTPAKTESPLAYTELIVSPKVGILRTMPAGTLKSSTFTASWVHRIPSPFTLSRELALENIQVHNERRALTVVISYKELLPMKPRHEKVVWDAGTMLRISSDEWSIRNTYDPCFPLPVIGNKRV